MGLEMDQAMIDELVGNAHGNLARVKEIITEHPELINTTATWKETPVEAAAQMGNRAIIQYLVGQGAPVDFFTALALADVETARQKLNNDSALAKARGVHELPALYFAAIGGSVAAAQMLLEAGADVNAKAEAAAPIHGAVMGGNREMVRFLVESGADLSLPDYKGRDARSLAVEMGRDDLAKLIPS
ncbi:MAG TPA: ankyrin repeat domain-containing protein [Candidatus Dormibacteraeota bacterium]